MDVTISKFSLLLLLLLFSCENSKTIQQMGGEFTLTGEITELKTKQVVLTYLKYNELINDTIAVINGEFRTKGIISNPVEVYLRGNIKKRGTSDPNYFSFFLEPKIIKISLIEDKFKEAKVTGSITQNEYEKLKLVIDPLNNEIKTINKEAKELRSKLKKNKDNSLINGQMEKLSQKFTNNINQKKAIHLKFIKNHPNSYLSAYLLNFYSSRIPIKEINKYYLNLSSIIRNSSYAKRVKNKIKIVENSKIGKQSPFFKTYDIEGNEFSLEMYKGKYIVLDFWADWCAPCIEKLPELKKLFQKYNLKGLEIVGFSLDKDVESWKKAVNKNKIYAWKHIYVGRQNIKGDSIFKSFNVNRIPALILINKKGIIEGRFLGADNSSEHGFIDLEKKLDKIFR